MGKKLRYSMPFFPSVFTGMAPPQAFRVPEPPERVCGHAAAPTAGEGGAGRLTRSDVRKSMGPGGRHPQAFMELADVVASPF